MKSVSQLSLKQGVLFFLPLGLFLALFSFSFSALVYRFNAQDTYYSHGFIIPLVSLYLVWRKRNQLKAIPIQPYTPGIYIIIAGVILHILSRLLRVNFGSYIAMPIIIEGMILYILGKGFARALWFPICFLVFMLPLPSVIIASAAFQSKILATKGAVALLKLIGISAIQDGSIIRHPNGFLTVGNPCSGLRSLISLIALGALASRLVTASTIKKWLLFISAVPIAICSNIVRITLLVLVSFVYGNEAALGKFHDISGMLVFVLAFLGLLAVGRMLKCTLSPGTI